jgi:NAD(P)-dependent dehydrogenase (short-subunit alcohol dehydrogenase family)
VLFYVVESDSERVFSAPSGTTAQGRSFDDARARIGEPNEVSSIALMLASDQARVSTGTEFVVDGGLTCPW